MSKRILLISNDSTGMYPENRLTAFTNVLPRRLPVRRRRRASVALEALSFSARFINTPLVFDLGRNDIACYSITNLTWRDGAKTFVIPHKQYTATSLVQTLNDLSGNGDDPPLKWSSENNIISLEIVEGVLLRMRADVVKWLKFAETDFDKKGRVGQIELYRNNHGVITGSKPIQLTTRLPKYIRVELNDLHHTIGTPTLRKTLAIVPCMGRRDLSLDGVFHHEIKRREPCQLDLISLENLSVSLVDETGERLALDIGQSTIVQLQLGIMASSKMLRFSTTDPGAAGRNSDCRFTLTEPLDLNKMPGSNWEVALTSIQYPARFKVYQQENNLKKDYGVKYGSDDELHHAILTSDTLDSADKIIAEIAAFLWEHTEENLAMYQEKNYIKFTQEKQLRWEKEKLEKGNQRLEDIPVDYLIERNKVVYLTFARPLAFMLGLVDSAIGEDDAEIQLQPNEIIRTAGYKVDEKRLQPNHMLILTDLVRPSVLGSRYLPLLKFIPVVAKNDGRHMLCYEAEHLNFISLSRSHISTINMKLCQSNGDTVAFKNDDDEILYNCLLRRKKKRKNK
jgi:hypothetical protein